jgi:hypothetical protein
VEVKEIAEHNRAGLAPLFQDYRWNYLADAILEGSMGTALADDDQDPRVAVLQATNLELDIMGGDAGCPPARAYVEQLVPTRAMFFASPGWEGLVQQIHGRQLVTMPRYAFTSETLDPGHLGLLASRVPDGYRLVRLDLELAQRLAAEHSPFSEDHMLNFVSPADFLARGFGFCLLDGAEISSVATTFAICSKGIEIQINTREQHRGRGLATVVAAQLILHSLEVGLDPNWDAASLTSAALAEKLGYSPQGTYSAALLVGSRPLAAFGRIALKIKEFFKQ